MPLLWGERIRGLSHGTLLTLVLTLASAFISVAVAYPIADPKTKGRVGFVGAIFTCLVLSAGAYNAYLMKLDDDSKAAAAATAAAVKKGKASPIPDGTGSKASVRVPVQVPAPAPPPAKTPAVPIKIVDMSARGGVQVGKPVLFLIATQNVSGGTLDVTNASLTGFKYLPSDPALLTKVEDDFWAGVLARLDQQGFQQEMTTAGDGVRTQMLTGQPLLPEQARGVMDGSGAIFFALVTVDSQTKQHLVEFCGYINKDMNVSYCSHHNKP